MPKKKLQAMKKKLLKEGKYITFKLHPFPIHVEFFKDIPLKEVGEIYPDFVRNVEDLEQHNIRGMTGTLENIICWASTSETDIMIHESVHIYQFLKDEVGIEDAELEAYMIQYIFTKLTENKE